MIKHYEIKNIYKIIGVHIHTNAQLWINCIFMLTHPQISLKDSNASFKMKTSEEKVKVRSFFRNISRVKKTWWSYGMGIMTSSKQVTYSYGYAQTKQQID